MEIVYELHATKNGRDYERLATFRKGEMWRNGTPINDETMVKEAQSFLQKNLKRGFISCQIIIQVNHQI